jgi:hypothetical protein
MSIFNNIPEDFNQVLTHMDGLRRNAQWSRDLLAHTDQGQGRDPHPIQQRDRHLSDHPRSRWRAIALDAERRRC